MMMNLPCLGGSCPNFLRPIYHTLSASQAPKRGHAPRKIPMLATALVFCLIVTDLHSSVVVLNGSVDAIPSQTPVGLLADVVRSRLHRLRVSASRTLLSLRYLFISHSAESWIMLLMFVACYAACDACADAGCLISFSIFSGS